MWSDDSQRGDACSLDVQETALPKEQRVLLPVTPRPGDPKDTRRDSRMDGGSRRGPGAQHTCFAAQLPLTSCAAWL